MSVVIDASVFVAFLFDETGSDRVEEALDDVAHISAVNFAEVLSIVARKGGGTIEQVDRTLHERLEVALLIDPVAPEDAMAIAEMYPHAQPLGIGIADLCCLSLARRLELPTLTADQAWAQLPFDVQIELIR